ncbi:hypothetical protein GH714_028652 [Hevea brasiliensis]|uniref:Anthocyanidin 3-O-glucosyltransferase n=1 Tax=Hevea brasiliensis TaxID=3981 RepID=A0A6A6LJT2_HEVBR|nr:hypothetical protein GH714_028652 [Hevea brasiliensis]
MMGRKPHVILAPYPSQGHVTPLMKLAYNLVDQEVKVTFVNTESIHAKLMSAMPKKFKGKIPISLVSIPEGLESNHDGKDNFQVRESASSFTQSHLQNFVENINLLNNEKQVSLVIADISVGWALEVAKKMGIKQAAFVPYGLGNLAMILHNPMLIKAGIIEIYGIPMKDEFISQSNEISA